MNAPEGIESIGIGILNLENNSARQPGRRHRAEFAGFTGTALCNLLGKEEFCFRMWHPGRVRVTVIAAAATVLAGLLTAPPANADPQTCNDAFCVPGINPHAVLGAPCGNTTYYVFGVDARNNWGRLVFCGSPRRYEPRWFRSPPMAGIRDENSSCLGELNMVAQAPDGLFLTCVPMNGETLWRRGDA